ncbi:helix-turn-helix transcriptional regulator [Pararoseomonas indoligenes]|uniref:YafY family transcriptional regulator n=1 Tax=Roseomonas indoligenes TaxID=2820811 RepID=A0A940S6I6_9PROT|nr:YafY family protein [Pararoseomonas indoligenes]MBP0494069.1 YafY family transcriptional regulator [Pararoseomonas indoligenes]
MSRAARLLELLQALRRRRRPVSAAALAEETGVSARSIYRDIATLRAQGARIEGEAGIGYVLRPGFFLPPLSFTEDEVDALILGLRLVARRGDETLKAAAAEALAKIEAVLPPGAAEDAAANGMMAGPAREAPHLAVLRRAIAEEQRLRLDYTDKKAARTRRVVWPVAIGFFETAEVLVAWCETRQGFRHFRLDRIAEAAPEGGRYPRRRRVLLAAWRVEQEMEGS